MRDRSILTFTDLADELGTEPKVISGLVRLLGITPKPTGMPGKAKGLSPDDVRRIRAALASGRRPVASAAD